MSEFDSIQKLIRLKRHEQPSQDFVEDFLKTFQHRQRAELLQKSARSLLWERVTTYFDDLMSPKWGWATATAVVLAFLGLGYSLKPTGNGKANNNSSETFVVTEVTAEIKPATDERFLISSHYNGGLADEPQVAKPQGGMSPVGLRLSEDMRLRNP
jgi:hypothetical protein